MVREALRFFVYIIIIIFKNNRRSLTGHFFDLGERGWRSMSFRWRRGHVILSERRTSEREQYANILFLGLKFNLTNTICCKK